MAHLYTYLYTHMSVNPISWFISVPEQNCTLVAKVILRAPWSITPCTGQMLHTASVSLHPYRNEWMVYQGKKGGMC